MSKKNYK